LKNNICYTNINYKSEKEKWFHGEVTRTKHEYERLTSIPLKQGKETPKRIGVVTLFKDHIILSLDGK